MLTMLVLFELCLALLTAASVQKPQSTKAACWVPKQNVIFMLLQL